MANEILPVVGKAISNVKGLEATSVSMSFPEKMTFDQWQDAGNRIEQVTDASQWWFGDWFNFGEDKFPHDHAQALTGKSFKTLSNLASVARRVSPETRRLTLSFRHHEAVAKFTPAQQAAFLDIAESESLNSDDFRVRIKLIEAEANKHTPVADGGETGEGESGEETVGEPETYIQTGVSRASIVALVQEHLDWKETERLIVDLRNVLAEQGIACEVTFNDGTNPFTTAQFGTVIDGNDEGGIPLSNVLGRVIAALPSDASKKDIAAAKRLQALLQETESAHGETVSVSVSTDAEGRVINAEIVDTLVITHEPTAAEKAEHLVNEVMRDEAVAAYTAEADTVADETAQLDAEANAPEIERVPVDDEGSEYALDAEPSEEVVSA